ATDGFPRQHPLTARGQPRPGGAWTGHPLPRCGRPGSGGRSRQRPITGGTFRSSFALPLSSGPSSAQFFLKHLKLSRPGCGLHTTNLSGNLIKPMNLSELKQKPIGELLEIAREMGLENLARTRKQDVIFSILKKAAKNGSDIYGAGVLEILQDGSGFLRSSEGSYLAGPDDIYVSPSQIRRFNLRTGDTISGKIRPPKEGERYFALLKVSEINFEPPENAKNKVLFENLTPLFPKDRLVMELGNGSTEDITARIIDMVAPIGKGQRALIVSPPKAGKTMMLQNIAHSIEHNHP